MARIARNSCEYLIIDNANRRFSINKFLYMSYKKNTEDNKIKSKANLSSSKEGKTIISSSNSKKQFMRKAFILAELIFKKKF